MIALNNSFEFTTIWFNCTSFDICCKDLSCSWYLHASVYKKSGVWVDHKFIDNHHCVVDTVKDDHMQATSWMAAECTKSFFKLKDKVHFRPHDVISYMKRHHGVNVSYNKTWRSREITLNSISIGLIYLPYFAWRCKVNMRIWHNDIWTQCRHDEEGKLN